jgi:hypothetical protein
VWAGLAVAGALAGLGAGVSVVAGPAAPAGADPMADCTTTTGVVVAVDFSHWGGNVERGCAAAPATGYDALVAAGYTVAGDQQDGPAFICRIDDEPPPSEDPCITTPPATAYWSYWHADAGQSTWTESPVGAMSYQPPPGSVDAWAFGAGQPPSVPPSAVLSTTPGPPPTTTTTTSTGAVPAGSSSPPVAGGPTSSAGGGSGGTASGGSGTGTGGTGTQPPGSPSTTQLPSTQQPGAGGTVGSSGATPAGGATATTTRPANARDGPVGGSTAHPRVVDVNPTAPRPRAPTGSPLPAILGGAVVIGLGGTGGIVAWRRRAGDP